MQMIQSDTLAKRHQIPKVESHFFQHLNIIAKFVTAVSILVIIIVSIIVIIVIVTTPDLPLRVCASRIKTRL